MDSAEFITIKVALKDGTVLNVTCNLLTGEKQLDFEEAMAALKKNPDDPELKELIVESIMNKLIIPKKVDKQPELPKELPEATDFDKLIDKALRWNPKTGKRKK